jgi:uncharacterized protein YukE
MNLVGDPAAINAMASLIDRKAGQLADVGRRVQERADRSRGRWDCTKAERFRHTTADRHHQTDGMANELHDLARQLRSVAVQVQNRLNVLHSIERRVRSALDADVELARRFASSGLRALPGPGDPSWEQVARTLGI